MSKLTALILISVSLYGPSALAADQFDLRCVGTDDFSLSSGPEPWRGELRIDLERKVYCIDECTTLFRIHDVLPDAIVLDDRVDESELTSETVHSKIDRKTGVYTVFDLYSRPIVSLLKRTAQCDVAPFKPFPNVKF